MAAPILVTGATGKVGTYVVQELVARGHQVRALVRSRDKFDQVRAAGADPVFGDLSDPSSLGPAVAGIETACLSSSPDPRLAELQNNFIDVARTAGVRYVVKISVLSAAEDAPFQLGRWHREAEKRLEASGMAWTHLRPQSFMQNLLAQAGAIAAEGVIYAPAGKGRVPLIDVRDVGAVAAGALTTSGHEGKAYLVTGPEAISYDEVAAQLSDATGRPVRYVDVPPEAARQGMVAMGLPGWLADDLIALFRLVAEGLSGEVTDVARNVAGREPIRFAQFARDYADAFRGNGRVAPA